MLAPTPYPYLPYPSRSEFNCPVFMAHVPISRCLSNFTVLFILISLLALVTALLSFRSVLFRLQVLHTKGVLI